MAHHDLDDAGHRSAGARAARQRHRHAAAARCSASATRRRSHMFDRGRTTRFDLHGHAVIHTAPNVQKVEPSADASGRLRAGLHRHDDVDADGALHAAADGALRRAHHHRQGRPRRGVARGVPRARRRLPRDHRRHGGARDDVDRGDRGRRPRRPQSREPVAIPHPRFRPAAGGDGQPRRQPLRRASSRRRARRGAPRCSPRWTSSADGPIATPRRPTS